MDINSIKTDVEKNMQAAKSLNETADVFKRYSSGLNDDEKSALKGYEDEFGAFLKQKFAEKQSSFDAIRFGPEETSK